MTTVVEAGSLFSKKLLPGATAEDMAAAHRHLQGKHEAKVKQLHAKYFNMGHNPLSIKHWKVRRQLVKQMRYHNRMANRHASLAAHHDSQKPDHFEPFTSQHTQPQVAPEHTEAPKPQFSPHPPATDYSKPVRKPRKVKPAAPVQHEEEHEPEQHPAPVQHEEEHHDEHDDDRDDESTVEHHAPEEHEEGPENHVGLYKHHMQKAKLHEAAKANLIARYPKEKDKRVKDKINTAIQQHHAQWTVHNKEALRHQQAINEMKRAKTEPEKVAAATHEVVARGMFSYRRLPGASHSEMAQHHQQAADYHNDAAKQLRSQYFAAPNKQARRDLHQQIKQHANYAAKHNNLANYHINKAQPKQPKAAPVAKPVNTAPPSEPEPAQPKSIPQPTPTPAPVAPPPTPTPPAQPAQQQHPVTQENVNWLANKSPRQRFDYTRKNPNTALAQAHTSQNVLPGKSAAEMQKYHQDQANFHTSSVNSARGLLKNNNNQKNIEGVNKFIDAHNAHYNTHKALADHFAQQANPATNTPTAPTQPAGAPTTKPQTSTVGQGIRNLGQRALKFFHGMSHAQKQSYAQTHPNSPLTYAHYGMSNLPYTTHGQMASYLANNAKQHVANAKSAAEQQPIDAAHAQKIQQSIQQHQAFARQSLGAARAHAARQQNAAAPSPKQVVQPPPNVPTQPLKQQSNRSDDSWLQPPTENAAPQNKGGTRLSKNPQPNAPPQTMMRRAPAQQPLNTQPGSKTLGTPSTRRRGIINV